MVRNNHMRAGRHKSLEASSATLPGLALPPPDLFVFHLEDDPNDRVLMKLAWKQTRLNVKHHFSESAVQALAYFKGLLELGAGKAPRWPDIAVLDVFMPTCSGFEVLKFIRATRPIHTLPVIILTGNSSRQLADEAYAAGANSVLVKPLSFGDTIRTLTSVHRYWSVAKLPPR
jgi:CheY-like chemotaxis protein